MTGQNHRRWPRPSLAGGGCRIDLRWCRLFRSAGTALGSEVGPQELAQRQKQGLAAGTRSPDQPDPAGRSVQRHGTEPDIEAGQHGAADRHVGKVPLTAGKTIKDTRNLQELRMKMEKAIQFEEFEEAAKLRDQIKELEKKDEAAKA